MITKEIQSILNYKLWVLLVMVWLFYLLGLFLFSHFVWSADIYNIEYTGNNFEEKLENYRHIDLIRYISSPLYVLFISGIFWLLFKAGLVFLKIQISDNLLFKIILLSLFILFLPIWTKVVWFVLIKGNYTQVDIKKNFPLSIVNFIDTSNISKTELNALGKLNLFNLTFMLFTAFCFKLNTRLTFFKSFIMIILTYGLGLLLFELIKIQLLF